MKRCIKELLEMEIFGITLYLVLTGISCSLVYQIVLNYNTPYKYTPNVIEEKIVLKETNNTYNKYCISKIALEDFNIKTNHNYTIEDLYNEEKAREIAKWVYNQNILYGVPNNKEDLELAYNIGWKAYKDGLSGKIVLKDFSFVE